MDNKDITDIIEFVKLKSPSEVFISEHIKNVIYDKFIVSSNKSHDYFRIIRDTKFQQDNKGYVRVSSRWEFNKDEMTDYSIRTSFINRL